MGNIQNSKNRIKQDNERFNFTTDNENVTKHKNLFCQNYINFEIALVKL